MLIRFSVPPGAKIEIKRRKKDSNGKMVEEVIANNDDIAFIEITPYFATSRSPAEVLRGQSLNKWTDVLDSFTLTAAASSGLVHRVGRIKADSEMKSAEPSIDKARKHKESPDDTKPPA